MVFNKNILFLCSLLILLLTIVVPINCNKFNSKINQSRYRRFPRQVNSNNSQQIGANKNVLAEKNVSFGTALQSKSALNQDVMDHLSAVRVIFPDDKRRVRQLNSNIYSQAYQDYSSQPWYAANKEYYDKYYENYYNNYYQTSTESVSHQYQQNYQIQSTLQSNQQSLPNRLSSINTLPLAPQSNQNDNNDEVSVFIDENGLFQIGKLNSLNTVSSVIDDDAIVFESDESRYDRRTKLNAGGDADEKPKYFNDLLIFPN